MQRLLLASSIASALAEGTCTYEHVGCDQGNMELCGEPYKVLFPPNERNGGRMLGYRFDPPSGPTSTVIAGMCGGGRAVSDMDEYANAMAAKGVSFISLVHPGAHPDYSMANFMNQTNPSVAYMSDVAKDYLEPVAKYLRANGATRVLGFGWALGNRFVRLAETRFGIFDGLVLASAGDTFFGFAPGTPDGDWDAIYTDETATEEARFEAWRHLYLGTTTRDMHVPGGWHRAHDVCTATYVGFINVFMGPLLYLREEWTTAKSAPILLLAGAEDKYAPFATNGALYKEWAPDTIHLVVVPGAGHMVPWEQPDTLADETVSWLATTFPDPCKPWCNQYLCNNPMCSSCNVCARQDRGHGTCSFWCNPYTCGNSHCAGCETCASSYCASWCNSFTASKMVCAGC